jgi:haloacetate dehalogenase
MTRATIDGFDYLRIPGDGGVELNVAVGGSGPAIVLLHGFPQTHYMWRHVAAELVDSHQLIVPDLRGYGLSAKPQAVDPQTYAKRTMARDILGLADALGVDRFALIGHDRGALVGMRAALDHPQRIAQLGILDVLPTIDSWEVLHGVNAAVAWHLYLMAQPEGLPERMIEAVAEDFFASFLDAWDPSGTTFTPAVRQHYIDSSVSAVPSIVADYRATAGVDLQMDRADREAGVRLRMPVAVISQDWGSQLGFDALELWRRWAPGATYQPTDAGHFMAEEKPDEIAQFVRTLVQRSGA